MERFEKIGIFLKNASTDEAVLAFAAQIGGQGTRELICVHVLEGDGELTETEVNEAKLDARVRAAMPGDISDRVRIEIRRGHLLEQVLRCARDEDLDLVIIGRKLPSSQAGIGTLITKIVRKSPCSVLVVPELCQPHFDRFLVAIDCSDHSREAMETAIAMARSTSQTESQLLALTIRTVSTGYDLAGVTFEESCAAQGEHGRKALESFMANIDTQGLAVESMVVISESPSRAITHVAMARKMDMVVVGSRGATLAAAALLGSTSENLLMTCAMPTLMVKKKGETLHFLEALFST